MSLETPEAIRRLQRKLYRKAKDEPEYRFYCSTTRSTAKTSWLMRTSWRRPIEARRASMGRPSNGIEARGLAEWLKELGNELRTRRYKPQPVPAGSPPRGEVVAAVFLAPESRLYASFIGVKQHMPVLVKKILQSRNVETPGSSEACKEVRAFLSMSYAMSI